MLIQITITDQPITFPMLEHAPIETIGACVIFLGYIRRQENENEIQGITYEAYTTMATKTMCSILESLAQTHPCERVSIIHRTGLVKVGEPAIFVCAWATHRKEAFALCSEFMDKLKKDVPIWKDTIVM